MKKSEAPFSFKEVIHRFEERRERLLQEVTHRHVARLPLKFLKQQAHFTTPASNYDGSGASGKRWPAAAAPAP